MSKISESMLRKAEQLIDQKTSAIVKVIIEQEDLKVSELQKEVSKELVDQKLNNQVLKLEKQIMDLNVQLSDLRSSQKGLQLKITQETENRAREIRRMASQLRQNAMEHAQREKENLWRGILPKALIERIDAVPTVENLRQDGLRVLMAIKPDKALPES